MGVAQVQSQVAWIVRGVGASGQASGLVGVMRVQKYWLVPSLERYVEKKKLLPQGLQGAGTISCGNVRNKTAGIDSRGA